MRRRWLDDDLSRFRFLVALAAIAVVGAIIRVIYVRAALTTKSFGYDSTFYYLQSGLIANGKGFINPGQFLSTGATNATAWHPPAYSALLAAEFKLGIHGIRTMQTLGALFGAITIALTGVLGTMVRGERVGLVAAAIVAVDPLLIAADGSLMSENLVLCVAVASMILTLWCMRSESPAAPLGLGVLLGIAALTRQDALIFAVALLIVLLAFGRAPAARRALQAVLVVVMMAVVIVPWVARNHARVGVASISTAATATAVAGANCPTTYYGSQIGTWSAACAVEPGDRTDPEHVWTQRLQRRGTTYIRDHLARLPLVTPIRVLRGLGLWAPRALATDEMIETRTYRWQLFAYAASLVLLVVGAFGILRRTPDRAVRALLAAVVITTFVMLAIGYANTRFRVIGEPALAIGAALVLTGARADRRASTAQTR
jgi:hypothetical protein